MRELLKCDLCPRHCAADRLAGATGVCRAGAQIKVYRWGPHQGEEPPLSGVNGSGTVFFSHCTLRCLYCQNYPWSACGEGEIIGTDELVRIFHQLAASGCHNINLVTPGPWFPLIQEAADRARAEGLRLPFVINTSGYERVEVAERYRSLMDIVLTDLRYATSETGRIGSGAANYVEYARAFIAWCAREIGPLELDEQGLARRGLIVRILVLPGCADEAVASLEWLAEQVGTDVAISVMSQYTPVHRAVALPGWDRQITALEYKQVTDCVERLRFENGWIQAFGEVTGNNGLLGQNMEPGGMGVAQGAIAM